MGDYDYMDSVMGAKSQLRRRRTNGLHHLAQACLLVFGIAGIWMISGPAGARYIWAGYVILIVSQIFWFIAILGARPLQWGMLLNAAVLTILWVRGLYLHL